MQFPHQVDCERCTKFEPSEAMYLSFTSEMYKRHVAKELAEKGILQDIDYEIVNEIDAEYFNEDLFVVRFGTE